MAAVHRANLGSFSYVIAKLKIMDLSRIEGFLQHQVRPFPEPYPGFQDAVELAVLIERK